MRLIRTAALTAAVTLASAAVHAQDQASTPTLAARSQEPAAGAGVGFVDKARAWAKEHDMAGRLNGDVDGWYPRLGRMTRGGGFALGPGYRFHPAGGAVLVDVSAAMSLKLYKAVDANVRWFRSANERIELWTDYRFEDFPQEDYFGRGLTSLQDNRTSYGFKSNDFLIRGIARPTPWLNVGANVGYMLAETGVGSDNDFPSIEQLFTDVDAPGLFTAPNYLHSTLFTEVDYRDVKGNPGSGGFYRIAFGVWDDRSIGTYDFRRLDVNLNQFVPLEATKRHVLYGRVGLAYTNNEETSRVPFYFLPYVGGVDTIRSFREFRYKDENAIWLGAEYLFRPNKYLGLAAFVDAGKVAPDWQDANLSDLKKGYGVGARFGTAKQQFLRIDIGVGGGEGTRIFLKFGPTL